MKKNLLLSLLVVLFVAACSNQAAPTQLPTSTIIPTYAYISPTPNPQFATAVATEAAVEAAATASSGDTETIALGRGRYEALNCGSCHGANGEGGGDKGPTLVGMTLSEDDFVTYLRTGGKLGSKHQYATNRLSDNGAHNLYLYLKSLAS